MLKLSDIREIFMKADRILKSGRFSFSLTTADKHDSATTHELILDYGTDEHGVPYGVQNGFPVDQNGRAYLPKPKLYVKDEDGNRIDIQTEAALRIKEFLDNFFEVSTVRTKRAEPSIWFKLIEDPATHDTTYNKHNITQFYRYLEANKEELVPHVMQTFKNNDRDILIPFVTADNVYYDVAKIINNEEIRSVSDVFEMMHNLITKVTGSINGALDILSSRIDDTLNTLDEKSKVHDRSIEVLEASVTKLQGVLKETNTKIDTLSDKVGKSFTKKSVHVPRGQILKIIFNPMKYGFRPAIDSYEKGADIFSSPLFITGEIGQAEIFVDIGVGSHIGIDRLAFYMDKNTSPRMSQPNMRIAQVGAAMPDNIISFAEQIQIGEYVLQFNYDIDINIWSKYIDYMEVETTLPPAEMASILKLVQRNKSRLNDLGIVPIKNSVVTRTSTTFLTRGFALNDNTILTAGGEKWHDLSDFLFDINPDSESVSGIKNYAPPKETLFINTTNISYDRFNKVMYMSTGYFKPGITADVIIYNRDQPSVVVGVIKSEPKYRLTSTEIALGTMKIPVDMSAYDIRVGDPYGIIITAPGYKTSDETEGVIKLR